jgi:hypothetical protein
MHEAIFIFSLIELTMNYLLPNVLSEKEFFSLSAEKQADELRHIHESHMTLRGLSVLRIVRNNIDNESLSNVFAYLINHPNIGVSRVKRIVVHLDIDNMRGLMNLIGASDKARRFSLIVLQALKEEFQEAHTRRHGTRVAMKLVAVLTESVTKEQSNEIIRSREFLKFMNNLGDLLSVVLSQMDSEHFTTFLKYLSEIFVLSVSNRKVGNLQDLRDCTYILIKVLKTLPTLRSQRIEIAQNELRKIQEAIRNKEEFHNLELQLTVALRKKKKDSI